MYLTGTHLIALQGGLFAPAANSLLLNALLPTPAMPPPAVEPQGFLAAARNVLKGISELDVDSARLARVEIQTLYNRMQIPAIFCTLLNKPKIGVLFPHWPQFAPSSPEIVIASGLGVYSEDRAFIPPQNLVVVWPVDESALAGVLLVHYEEMFPMYQAMKKGIGAGKYFQQFESLLGENAALRLCGEAIYRAIEGSVERNKDSCVAIEPISGDYVVASNELDGFNELRKKHPDRRFYFRDVSTRLHRPPSPA